MNPQNIEPPLPAVVSPQLHRTGPYAVRSWPPLGQGEPFAVPAEPGPAERIAVSIVIPLYNERDNLRLLYGRLREALNQTDQPYEVIFIDDGSTDGSFAILQQLHADDPQVRVIQLRRNFGQAAAFSAGFDLARGEVVVTLDADLQNDPADIPKLLAKIAEDYDVVSGWRVRRQDAYLTRQLPSRMANWLIATVTGVHLHDFGCSLKAYRREVLSHLELYGQLHRFLPCLVSWMGPRMTEVAVAHERRRFGQSKYGLKRVIMVILDLITVKFLLHYSTRPLQVFGPFGLLATFLGIVIGAYLSVIKLAYSQPLADRPLLLLAILLITTGVQFVTMGLLGELVVRNYREASGRRIYAVRKVLVHAPAPDRPAVGSASQPL